MMTGQHALGWLHAIDCRRARTVVEVPGGRALLHADFPAAHDHNKLSVVQPCTAGELVDAAETVLGGAGLQHRLVEVRSPTVTGQLAPDLLRAGYTRTDSVVQQWSGGDLPLPRREIAVQDLSLVERAAAATSDWSRDLPAARPEVWRQLGQRISTMAAAARSDFLAVRDAGGQVLARADLYVWDGVAQVEEVMTGEASRGRGYASALVLAAVTRALAADVRSVLIVADAQDWPQELYRRLGFADLTTTTSFSR